MPFCLISFYALVLLVLNEWNVNKLELRRSIYSQKNLKIHLHYILCRRSNIFPLIRNSLTSWLRLLYLYWPKMVEVMMVFPSLLPSSILFCKGMDLGVLESCIRGMLLLIDYCHVYIIANIYV